MPTKKDSKAGGLANLIRDESMKAKARSAADSKAGEGNLEERSSSGRTVRIFDILTFITADWGLNMPLYPAQRVIVKLYYNIPLDAVKKCIEIKDWDSPAVKHHFTEKEYLEYLYDQGRCNIREQDHVRRQLLLSIGRRAGKTTLSAIFASYELYRLLSLYSPQDYYGLPSGNRIQILSIATGKDQAQLLFNDVTSHFAKCTWFQPYIANNTLSHVNFRTPYDIDKYGPTARVDGKFQSLNGKASIRVTFKPAISTSLRGFGNIVIIFDEMAHFQDEGKSSAKEIYDAVIPSALAFSPKDPNDRTKPIGSVEARIIGISSPLNKAGKFYELYHFAMSKAEGSENILAIQAPTWEVNPTVSPEFLRQKYHEDPAVFMTEYGAEFSDRVRGWIERDRDLLACIDPDLRPRNFGPPRFPHQMGIDVGLVGDGTSIAITHIEGDRIVLDYHETWSAGVPWRESNPHLEAPLCDYAKTLEGEERLDFDEIAKWIIAITRRFYITDGIFDRWNGIPLEQTLQKAGLNQFRSEFFTREARSRMFQAVKLLIFDRKVSLYNWPSVSAVDNAKEKHSPLIAELLALQANQTSHNQIMVSAPKIAGAHDDMSDALVRAIWMSLERMQNTKVTARGQRAPGNSGPQHMTAGQYQRGRMRSHGLNTERMAKNPFRR